MMENEERDPAATDPDPDPEQAAGATRPGSAQDESEADDFEHDPARNPEDDHLKDLKGG